MCSTWLLHIYTQLTFHKRSSLTICYLNDDGHILATAWYKPLLHNQIFFQLTNFICQMFSDHVNWEFLICKLGILSKNPNLHGQKIFDIWNLSKKIWSCKRGYILGSFQKRTILHPQRKFPLSMEEEGNHIKNVLNLCRMYIKGKGGIVNFLHGGYGYFLEQPILWKRKKKLLSRYKIPCIF